MKKDTRSEQLDKLKQANRKLKGELLKARKKIRVLQTMLKRYTDLDESLLREPDILVVEEVSQEPKCPACKAILMEVPAGIYTLQKCTNCDYKNKLKET